MFVVHGVVVGFVLGFLIYVGLKILGNSSKQAPLPPGPKGLPMVGNLNDLPPPGVFEAHHWLKFKDLYGTASSRNTVHSEPSADNSQDLSALSRFFIPKDAIIMPNIWYFAHDPEVHQDPMRFNPERFLSTDSNQPEQDPHTYTFGFGRRVCPGRVLADNALFLNIAQSLAVLHIRKGENGAQPELLFTPGMISHPEPFKAAITPRSPHHEELIRSLEQQFPWEQSDSHIIEKMQRQGS